MFYVKDNIHHHKSLPHYYSSIKKTTMTKVRYLKLRFDFPIFSYDIPRFRGAVIEKTNRISALFHNHKEEDQVIYRYPLIQYKVSQKKATIVCLNEGTDEIHHLLQHRQLDLQIGDQVHHFEIEDIQLNYFNVQIWQTTFQYSLLNWLALNQDNFATFQALNNDIERIRFLEKKLTNTFISFAKGIQWQVEGDIQLRIHQIKEQKWLPYKGQQKLLAFTLNFECNVTLPDYIGLGKGSSVGFGVVKRING